MARVNVALYEEDGLPVEISRDSFSFGEVVYLTIGGVATADTVILHLSPGQLAVLAAAVGAYCRQAREEAGCVAG